MPDIQTQPPISFYPGQTIDANFFTALLNALTLAPSVVSGKTQQTAPKPTDTVLILTQTTSGPALQYATLQDVLASGQNLGLAQVYVGDQTPAGPAPGQDPTGFVWIQTAPPGTFAASAGVKVWNPAKNSGAGGWSRINGPFVGEVTLLTAATFNGSNNNAPNFDSTGLGQGSLDGWAIANGQNGTPNLGPTTTVNGQTLYYGVFIGYQVLS